MFFWRRRFPLRIKRSIDTAKLYSLPLFQKYFANTFFVKAFEKNIRAKSPDRKFGQYMLVTSPDLTPDSINVLIQLPDAAEMKTALIQSKQAVPVKYGGNTFYRMDNGVEFAFLADNLMLFSTGTGMKTYFSAKKGLSPKLSFLPIPVPKRFSMDSWCFPLN